jgi:AbrB family looped-hinge helix DNA binding protein
MAIVKVRRFAQVTLPANLRKKLHLVEGDYLEAEAVKGGILLKPVTVIERERAKKRLLDVMDQVHTRQRRRKKSPKEQEEEIARVVKDFRRQHA